MFINRWLLSVRMLLGSLYPYIVGNCPSVVTWVSIIIRYRLFVIVGSVRMLLGFCPSIV